MSSLRSEEISAPASRGPPGVVRQKPEAVRSKVALASLVRTLIPHGFRMLDCQQNTRHLASLGAREIPRETFLAEVAELVRQPGPDWRVIGIELPDA